MNRAPPLTQLQSTVEATAASPSPSTSPNRPTAEARSLLATAWLRFRRSKIALVSLCEREFVETARSLGASHLSVLFRQIIPNVLGVVLVSATMLIPTNISAEAALPFLGLGKIVEQGPGEELFRDPRHPYTQALLSAVPLQDPRAARQQQRCISEIPLPASSSAPACHHAGLESAAIAGVQ
ncbi:oligopeptide/dipeptide ABC transporter ATP-binding protein [Arthrobacter sp. NPDC080031]|uniref:oligopeptide/dipeptide ABC transporter ATP-binding protein n=1 Tax=Arthrobacter sp. NPDC080031 TaxID=3155918 RepID=UPI00344D8600